MQPKLISLFLMAGALCFGQPAAREVFLQSCASCHGKDGAGADGQSVHVKPPDLRKGLYKAGSRDEDLARVIANGVPESGMPAFQKFGDARIRDLVAFVRSLAAAQTPVTGDAAQGESLFFGSAGCAKCHAIGSRGTPFGPDLTSGGGEKAAERIRQSIEQPDEDIAPGFESVTVVLKTGQAVTGLPRYIDNFSVRILERTGAERTFLRRDVASVKREWRSLMPAIQLSSSDIDNLIAYLLKIRSHE